MTTDHDTTTVPARAGRRQWIALAVLALPCMLVTMDLTVLFLAVPKLTAAMSPSTTELLWITDVYGFLIAGALIVMGTLGDRIGRRRLLLAGAAAFGIASLLAALATSPGTLIAARALQGLAGATLLPSIMALIFNMFRDEVQRTAALGMIMSCFAAGAALGPLLGGVLLESFWWGSVFLPNLPVMALLLVLGPRLLPEFRNPAAGRIDVPSAALSLVGILAFVFGVKELAQHGAGPRAVLAIAAGLAIGAVFVRRQGRLGDPLLDVSLFRIRAFSTALSANVLGALVMYGSFFFTSQYLQLVLGLSPLEAGLWGLPGIAVLMVTAMLVPKLVQYVRPGYVVAGGLAVAAVGFAMLTTLDAAAGLELLVPALMVASIGIAPAATLGTNLIVGAAPPERAGAASGVAETGNELGGALGIALLGSLGTALYRGHMEDAVPEGVAPGVAAAARDTLGGAVSVADRLPGAALDAAEVAFAQGLHVVAATCAVLMAGMAIVTAVLLRHVPASAAAEAGPDAEPARAPGFAPAPAPAG
jgi:MFS transporter, DHA2 family, multidrug resistance protein